MPYYVYEARNKAGKSVKNQTFAVNKQELIKILQKEGLMIVSVKESAPMEERYRKSIHKKTKLRDLILFSKEMAILLENGVPIIDAFDIISKQIESSELSKVVKQMKQDVEAGGTFCDAIAKHPKVFGTFWHDMIEAGELSGQLPFVIRQVAIFLESRDELRKKTVNAFLYPALLLILATFTIFVFVFRVVPIFEELFSTFNTKLPFFTTVVVTLSEILRRFFVVGIVIAVIAAFLIRQTIATKQGRRLYENAVLNTPLIGSILMALSTEKLTTTLGVLLKSGIPIIKALEVSAKATQSVVFTERMEEAKVKVMAGLPLSDAMQQTGLFPPLVIQLVLVGEKTGNFSGMMEEISKYYSDLIDTAVTRFTTLLGPIVLIIMAFIIGSLIIAMFMPIFKLTGLG